MRDGISVIIPVYNGARYLSECIQSVRDQTVSAAEVIVIDDGSEDDTPAVAATWGPSISYRRVAHGGLPYARNHGLRLAQTEFIAFVDSDDIWAPNKLEVQLAALLREATPTMVFGYVQQFVSPELPPEEAARLKCDPAPLPGWFSSTLLARKSDCERAGPFDESISTGEFIEWFSRARDAGIKAIQVPEVVCRRRLHLNNMGRGGVAMHSQYTRMIKAVLDRRRAKE